MDADGHWHEHIVPEDAPRDDVPGSPDDTYVVTSDEQETVVLAYVLRVDVPDRPDDMAVITSVE